MAAIILYRFHVYSRASSLTTSVVGGAGDTELGDDATDEWKLLGQFAEVTGWDQGAEAIEYRRGNLAHPELLAGAGNAGTLTFNQGVFENPFPVASAGITTREKIIQEMRKFATECTGQPGYYDESDGATFVTDTISNPARDILVAIISPKGTAYKEKRLIKGGIITAGNFAGLSADTSDVWNESFQVEHSGWSKEFNDLTVDDVF